jgi:hypothetical protein
MQVQVASFLASVLIQVAILLVCVFLFEVLRTLVPAFYTARLRNPSEGYRAPPALKSTAPLAWLPAVWGLPDSDVLAVAGMDALAFLRVQKFGRSKSRKCPRPFFSMFARLMATFDGDLPAGATCFTFCNRLFYELCFFLPLNKNSMMQVWSFSLELP